MTDATEQRLARLERAVAQLALLADDVRRQPELAEIVLEYRKDRARQPGRAEVVPPSDFMATEIDSQDLPALEPEDT